MSALSNPEYINSFVAAWLSVGSTGEQAFDFFKQAMVASCKFTKIRASEYAPTSSGTFLAFVLSSGAKKDKTRVILPACSFSLTWSVAPSSSSRCTTRARLSASSLPQWSRPSNLRPMLCSMSAMRGLLNCEQGCVWSCRNGVSDARSCVYSACLFYYDLS